MGSQARSGPNTTNRENIKIKYRKIIFEKYVCWEIMPVVSSRQHMAGGGPDTILLLSRSVNYKMASFVTLLST